MSPRHLPTTLPLLLHLLIETPASLSFLLTPHLQLPGASPDAKLILRNFGGLLLATNLACLVLLANNYSGTADDTEMRTLTARLCLCVGTYHLWPTHRAWARMKRGGDKGKQGEKKVLGGPKVHLIVHVVCFVALIWGGMLGLKR